MIKSKHSAMLSVDEITARVKRILEFDPTLSNVAVEGEITEFKRHSSGHVYFTLAGQASLMHGVMFRSDAHSVIQWPQVGDRVAVFGRIGLYPQRLTVQIYARKMVPLGSGAAARAREEVKRRLEAQGLFALERKRPLPAYPRRVACLTSPTGAAVQDVCTVWKKRFPAAELMVVPCLVQGIQAVSSMVAALQRTALIPDLDVIMLVRGGGGRDDLNPFDDEELVLEVARCGVPLVTGVGHQTDWTLCDLAADFRAPTPSAAAELVFPDRQEILQALSQRSRQFRTATLGSCEVTKNALDHLKRRLGLTCKNTLEGYRQRLDDSEERLARLCSAALRHQSIRLDGLERTLQSLSPRTLAERGYMRCFLKESLVTSVGELASGDRVTLQFFDGDARCQVDRCCSRSHRI